MGIKRVAYKKLDSALPDFEIVDIQLFMATRPRHHLMKDYRLSFWIMIYITKGCGTHYVDFEAYNYKAGDIIIVQKGQVHHFELNNDLQGYVIMVNEPFFFDGQDMRSNDIFSFFDRPYKSPVLSVDDSKDSTNRTILETLYKEYMKPNSNYYNDLIRSLFYSFVVSLREFSRETKSSPDTPAKKTFNEFRRLVEDNFTTIKTVDEYSNRMLVSKKTINAATRSVVDLSAKQFIINRIILEIKRYLSQGDLMNYEISELLGFDEPSNLTKFFKRYEGISPSEFRESLK